MLSVLLGQGAGHLRPQPSEFLLVFEAFSFSSKSGSFWHCRDSFCPQSFLSSSFLVKSSKGLWARGVESASFQKKLYPASLGLGISSQTLNLFLLLADGFPRRSVQSSLSEAGEVLNLSLGFGPLDLRSGKLSQAQAWVFRPESQRQGFS
jgi:hypothetical protein